MPNTPEWEYALRVFNHYRTYEDDWDEDGSPAPSREYLDAVENFLRNDPQITEEAPTSISLMPEGNISLCWRMPEVVKFWGLQADGIHEFFGKPNGELVASRSTRINWPGYHPVAAVAPRMK